MCELMHRHLAPIMVLGVVWVIEPPPPPRRRPRLAWPILTGLVLGFIAGTLAGILGASQVVQIAVNLGTAIPGMFLGAAVVDHVTGVRRLSWPRFRRLLGRHRDDAGTTGAETAR